MTTLTLTFDNQLLDEAQEVGENQSLSEIIQTALAEYIRHRQQLKIFELSGTINYDPDYDYKKERFRK